MKIEGKVHCFFEQSGTFKNEFIKLGIPAEDYDIQNNFGETDHVIDLFQQIEDAYEGKVSIFDKIGGGDLIMAFFPCIYFCENNELYFTGRHHNLSTMSEIEKIDIIIERADNRNRFYVILLKLFGVCEKKGIRMIVENPFSVQHYLHNNFPYAPKIIDRDRTRRGDFYKKPTQYLFVNCTNTIGRSYQKPIEIRKVAQGKGGVKAGVCSEERSMISPDYARNFICDFIIGREQEYTQMDLFGYE